jgi:hypothetical protein
VSYGVVGALQGNRPALTWAKSRHDLLTAETEEAIDLLDASNNLTIKARVE